MRVFAGLAVAMLIGVGAPGTDRVVPLPVYAAEQAADQAAKVVAEMRRALGGTKLEQVKSLSVEGPFRREAGPRQMEGTTVLTLVGPDKMHKAEENVFPGGMSVERVQALNGDTSWTDIQNRGGMGGGMQIVMRDGPPPGPGVDPAAAEQRRTNMFRSEMQRWMFALLAQSSGEITYAGIAESPDGKADCLVIKDARGQDVRLFVDQETHLPLMLAYQDVRPRMMMRGGPGGRGPGGPGGGPGAGPGGQGGGRPDPEEMRRRMESMPPPEPSAMQMRFDEYASVDGVKLPKRITISADGKPVEEWTIEKIKVNPPVKADLFVKK